MSNLNVSPEEETLIVLGLVLVDALLPYSGYPEPLREKLRAMVKPLIEKIQNRHVKEQKYDAYGNPY